MLQIHPNARTTPADRAEIARSDKPTGVLARRYGVSTETIRKWRKRGPDDCLDHSAKPHSLPWKATEEERAVVCALRRATNFALDDLTFVVTHFLPHLDRRRPRRHRQGTPHRRSCQGGLATTSGRFATINELVTAEKINSSYVSRVLRLTLLAPDIVEAILDGRQIAKMTLPALMPLEVEWCRQQRCL
jgi:transposase-like protein